MNVCEKNQPLAVFLHFSPEVPTRHSLYTNAKERKKFISRIFALKRKSKGTLLISCSFLGYLYFIRNCEVEFCFTLYTQMYAGSYGCFEDWDERKG